MSLTAIAGGDDITVLANLGVAEARPPRAIGISARIWASPFTFHHGSITSYNVPPELKYPALLLLPP